MTPAPTPAFTLIAGDVRPEDPFYEPSATVLPAAVDLRATPYGFPPVYNQGPLNSCTSNAIAAVLAFDIRRQKLDDTFEPSRLFIYYNERYIEHAIGSPRYGNHGAPAYMRDCIDTVDGAGFCAETEWPYVLSQFDTRPPDGAYQLALGHRGCDSFRLRQDLAALKGCLADGYPFVCGIVIHASYLGARVQATGVVPLPAAGEMVMGGHALAVVGYDDATETFLIRNSFGDGWGEQGYGRIPYAYLANPLANPPLAMDFWLVRKVVEQ